MVDQVQPEARSSATDPENTGQRPDLPYEIDLSDNARTVLSKRYLRKGPDGQPAESIEEMFWRVAWHVAGPEEKHVGKVGRQRAAERYYEMLTRKNFFPNSPTFTGAGTPLGQLAACFVLAIDDDMGRTGDGIFQTLRNAALIQQTGGGNGFAFSRLRPKGARVASSNGKATGPVGFLRVYDQAFGEVAQGGCLIPDTLVFTGRGLLRLDEIVTHDQPGWDEHLLTVPTDEGPRTSTAAYNNGIATVLRVTTDAGIALTGTSNHKVKVMGADGPEWRRLDDLRPGDALLVKLGQHQGEVQTLVQPERQHGNQVMPNLPTELDEEFAFFLGYMAGDGFVASGESDHRVGVSVAHDSYLMDEMPAIMGRLFGGQVNIHRQQKSDDASVTYVIDNRAVKDFLTLNDLAKEQSADVRVPRLVRQSPPEVVGAFLQGLFEADGSVSHHYPQLLSTSETLIREAATLLIGLGCPVRVRVQESTGSNRYGTQPMWYVRVNSFVGLEAWAHLIGCDERSRFAACYEFEPDLSRETSYALPNPAYWVEPVLDATRLPQIDRQGRGRGINFRATEPRLRRQLLRYLRGDRALTRSGYERLASQYEDFAQAVRPGDDQWFVAVESVEEAGESLTLDLEVNGNHTYLANGIVTHNSRRGANMGVLRVDHPDIREFITCKVDENAITNFNISVGITDAFMEAVKADAQHDLVNPQNGEVWETVPAREIFEKIVTHAHHNGEPGMLFLDAANRDNPVPHLYELEASNPCGEQLLGPNENCCLGSINLAQHITADGSLDWEKLRETVTLATRFLDDVVDANAYVPAVPELEIAAQRVRRIGLGIMGLGDLMYALGVRYGSEEGQEFAAQVMEFVHYHCMATSVELAQERGSFLAIAGSLFDPDDLKWQPPTPLRPYERDWGRPAVDWQAVEDGIKAGGIRNGAHTTIAPTGTISTVAGVEGYGCEPVFALAYVRYFDDSGTRRALQYTSPRFEKALIDAGIDGVTRSKIIEQVNVSGSCQSVPEVPEDIKHRFVVSADISAEEHVYMQAAMQRFVSNSISKTCNFPSDASEADVAQAFQLAWELGCKGLTVYVAGSREKVVLETAETQQQRDGESAEAAAPAPAEPVIQPKPTQLSAPGANGAGTDRTAVSPGLLPLFGHEPKKPRGRVLPGYTYRLETPLGTAFITVNENGGGEPFEVFMHTAKAGSETAAISEAVGRLISYILRMRSPLPPNERLKEVVRQLSGIGGGRSLGLGPNRVRSLPDGMAQVLDEYLKDWMGRDHPDLPVTGYSAAGAPPQAEGPIEPSPGQMALKFGDLCPECGQAAVVNEEGCRKCYACGFSEC